MNIEMLSNPEKIGEQGNEYSLTERPQTALKVFFNMYGYKEDHELSLIHI